MRAHHPDPAGGDLAVDAGHRQVVPPGRQVGCEDVVDVRPQWADSRIKVAPGWVSANTKVDQSLYTDPVDKISGKYLADPDATFRFDASDAMPAAVGSGARYRPSDRRSCAARPFRP